MVAFYHGSEAASRARRAAVSIDDAHPGPPGGSPPSTKIPWKPARGRWLSARSISLWLLGSGSAIYSLK